MVEPTPTFAERINGLLLATLWCDAAMAEDLCLLSECLAETGGGDADALRQAGMGVAPPGGAAGILMRSLVYGVFTPMQRSRLRRGVYRCIGLSSHDELAAIAATAAAVIAADLCRGFEIEDCLVRCRQTLLEEAPTALLEALRSLPAGAEFQPPTDVLGTLQLGATTLGRAHGVQRCAELLATSGEARAFGAALSAIRDGVADLEISSLKSSPLYQRVRKAADAFAAAAMPPELSAAAG